MPKSERVLKPEDTQDVITSQLRFAVLTSPDSDALASALVEAKEEAEKQGLYLVKWDYSMGLTMEQMEQTNPMNMQLVKVNVPRVLFSVMLEFAPLPQA